MNKLNDQDQPFFMIFPWMKVATGIFILFLGMMVVYRLSETAGTHVNHACLAAFIVTATAGLLGLYVISTMWGKDVYWVLIGVMLAMMIRLLISGGSFAIIIPFTKIKASWYIFFLAIYYLIFLVTDTWFAIWILRHSKLNKERDGRKHGNLWDIFG